MPALVGKLAIAAPVSKQEVGHARVATAGQLLGSVTHVAADGHGGQYLSRIRTLWPIRRAR